MSFLKKKPNMDSKRVAIVAGHVLFEVLKEDLKCELCTDIIFHVLDSKESHRFGAYGDYGNTKTNVKFFLDDKEYASYDDLYEQASLDDKTPLHSHELMLVVTECNGCYPESTPMLIRNDMRTEKKQGGDKS